MIAYEPLKINTTTNTIPIEPISDYDKNSGYVKDATRIYNGIIYKAQKDIAKTVDDVFHNEDPSNIYAYNLYTESNIEDLTSVPIVSGVTIVYVITNQKYFMASTTGSVNYLTEDFEGTPANFTDLGTAPTTLYRLETNNPDGRRDTLFWKYMGTTNKNKMFDGTSSQSINDRTFNNNDISFTSSTKTINTPSEVPSNIYDGDRIRIVNSNSNDGIYNIDSIAVDRLSFTVIEDLVDEIAGNIIFIETQTVVKWSDKGIDKISFFNIDCEEINIKVSVNGTPTEDFTITMSDSSFITTFELFVFNEPSKLTTLTRDIIKNFNQDFEVSFFGSTQKIGQLVQGSSIFIGDIQDNADLGAKVLEGITEASNGDVYIDSEKVEKSKKDDKTFNFKYDSNTIDSLFVILRNFAGKEIILAGSENEKYDFIQTRGFTKEVKMLPQTRHDLSTHTLKIREI